MGFKNYNINLESLLKLKYNHQNGNPSQQKSLRALKCYPSELQKVMPQLQCLGRSAPESERARVNRDAVSQPLPLRHCLEQGANLRARAPPDLLRLGRWLRVRRLQA